MGYNPMHGQRAIPLIFEILSFTGRLVLSRLNGLAICVAVTVLGIVPLAKAQRLRSITPETLTPADTPAEKPLPSSTASEGVASAVGQRVEHNPTGTLARPYSPPVFINGAIDVGMCSWSFRPTWCKGSDVGAWTNSAIAVAGCGEVYIPAGTYLQTTTIVKPRCIKLHGPSANSTFLKWVPQTGVAIVMGDGTNGNFAGEGALEDLTLVGPGTSTLTCGIYIGGSDGTGCAPSTILDPSTNLDDHDNINRVRIFKLKTGDGFGVGIQWGNNSWSNTIFESDISFNGTGLYVPGTTSQTGENLSILNSVIGNNIGVGLSIATGNNINFTIVNTSFDYNGSWAVQNGTAITQNAVSLVNCYLAQRSNWLQNYGYMNIMGVDANDGADSGILGYLIDNEAAFLTVLGGGFFNNGTGAILNPSGVASTWLGPVVTSPGANGLTPTATYIDRLGDFSPTVLWTDHFNQNTANRVAGTSSCSAGAQTITFPGPYANPPVVLLFDETTKGGVSLTGKGTWGFIVSCSGASDTFDWIVVGNPN
jgi:hypothetical protein